ncbi:hypothetical protein EYF80_055613 [Liparis tanakae]|uniref:Uncharacterized protein n=1 Tax=Liparis tanakae TaxID=230148 RepID=A0A4Z2F0D2_9TELE|nr:hypothetical protein EYF80_055613 [Liparis tanakae]
MQGLKVRVKPAAGTPRAACITWQSNSVTVPPAAAARARQQTMTPGPPRAAESELMMRRIEHVRGSTVTVIIVMVMKIRD